MIGRMESNRSLCWCLVGLDLIRHIDRMSKIIDQSEDDILRKYDIYIYISLLSDHDNIFIKIKNIKIFIYNL